jgi:hypothetical protein
MRNASQSMKMTNDVSLKETTMTFNDSQLNCGKTCGKVRISTEVADKRAERLVQIFHAPQCRLFFLKCIYHLTEHDIEEAVEASMKPEIKSKIRYFTVVAKNMLEKVGY